MLLNLASLHTRLQPCLLQSAPLFLSAPYKFQNYFIIHRGSEPNYEPAGVGHCHHQSCVRVFSRFIKFIYKQQQGGRAPITTQPAQQRGPHHDSRCGGPCLGEAVMWERQKLVSGRQDSGDTEEGSRHYTTQNGSLGILE